MAGYSGTPLARKLGLKEGQRIALYNAPAEVPSLLGPVPPGISWRSDLRPTLDGVLLFAPMAATLDAAIGAAAAAALTPAGMLLVVPPASSVNVIA